ncbi:translation initiation factor IF-2-like [Ursus americanus]|uniref:translation initiation factor IF-2-like n=1 Tax=Ursus americanus TaxID=9643 RepID=UPI001E6794A7|nr:translation initiation factor IF-2-like [Ursus americanus]
MGQWRARFIPCSRIPQGGRAGPRVAEAEAEQGRRAAPEEGRGEGGGRAGGGRGGQRPCPRAAPEAAAEAAWVLEGAPAGAGGAPQHPGKQRRLARVPGRVSPLEPGRLPPLSVRLLRPAGLRARRAGGGGGGPPSRTARPAGAQARGSRGRAQERPSPEPGAPRPQSFVNKAQCVFEDGGSEPDEGRFVSGLTDWRTDGLIWGDTQPLSSSPPRVCL